MPFFMRVRRETKVERVGFNFFSSSPLFGCQENARKTNMGSIIKNIIASPSRYGYHQYNRTERKRGKMLFWAENWTTNKPTLFQ